MRPIIFSLLTVSMLILAPLAGAATYLVEPDGSGDFPTIQAALNAVVAGDIILLGNGTFVGAGNRDLDFKGKAVTVGSLSGHPEDCIIDVQGVPWIPQRGFDFKSSEGADSVVRDLTIQGGTTEDC